MRAALPILAALVVGACHSDPAPLVTVHDARVIALPASAAVYFSLVDSGGRDRLLGVDAPGVGRASLHETNMAGGIMRMRKIEGGVEIPPGATILFSPSGKHVMIEHLVRPLAAGSSIRLTLEFQRQGKVTITAPIDGPR